MNDRRPIPCRDRRVPHAQRLLIVQHHQQSAAGPRHMGFIVSVESATLFLSRSVASCWSSRNLAHLFGPVAGVIEVSA